MFPHCDTPCGILGEKRFHKAHCAVLIVLKAFLLGWFLHLAECSFIRMLAHGAEVKHYLGCCCQPIDRGGQQIKLARPAAVVAPAARVERSVVLHCLW